MTAIRFAERDYMHLYDLKAATSAFGARKRSANFGIERFVGLIGKSADEITRRGLNERTVKFVSFDFARLNQADLIDWE